MSIFAPFTKSTPALPAATQIISVPIDNLLPDPENERKTFNNMDGLIASIRNVGIVEPPVVKPLPNGMFQLLTGHRRWAAAKQLGHDTLDVVVRSEDEPDDHCQVRLKSLVSNLQRESVPPLELAETLQGILDDPNGIETQRHIAHHLGKSESWVSDTLALLRLAPPLQAKLRDSETKVSLDAVSKIARIEDPEHQKQLLDRALTGTPSTTIRQEISEATQARGASSTNKPTIKPKVSYRTQNQAVVIIQSRDTHPLDRDQQRAALKDAFLQVPSGD